MTVLLILLEDQTATEIFLIRKRNVFYFSLSRSDENLLSDFKSLMTKPRAHDTSGRTCHSKTRVYVFLGVTSGKELGFDRQ